MIYDLHNDFLTGLPRERHRDYLIRGLKQSVKHIVPAIWTTEIKNIKDGFFRNSTSHIDDSDFGGLIDGYAIEDLHFLDSCSLGILSEIPLKYVGLTWNFDNALAGGALGNDGLKPLGRQVLVKAENLGITVDTAHLNRKSFFDVAQYHRGRIMNSHCAFYAKHAHPRNLTDEQIQTVIDRGGIIGLALHEAFLSDKDVTLSDAVEHIDYFVQKFGCDNLCIGTDFNGCTPPHDLSDYCDFRILKVRLAKLGYSDSDINSIFYKNAMDFFAQT